MITLSTTCHSQAYSSRDTREREIAAELAVHFELGRDYPRAVRYRRQAGENAIQKHAYREAINHLDKGLGLLEALPDTHERIQQELLLQITLGPALIAINSYAAPEVEKTYTRAQELYQRVGETPQLFRALMGMFAFYLVRAEYKKALELGEQLERLAHRQQDSALLLEVHFALGLALLYLGKLASAQAHLEQGINLYDPTQHRSHFPLYGQDPGMACRAHVTWPLWICGYPEQALERSREAIALAQKLANPFDLAFAQHFAALTHQFRREDQAAHETAKAEIAISSEHGFPFWLALGTITQGGALAELGWEDQGIKQMCQGLRAHHASGAEIGDPYWLSLLANGYKKVGQAEKGLTVLAKALATVRENEECWWEAELYRLKGELLLMHKGKKLNAKSKNEDILEPEECFHTAITIARQQNAKSLELRAVMSLSRLWQHLGKKEEAHRMLAEVYSWFTEGFNTKDLQEAKALLEELA